MWSETGKERGKRVLPVSVASSPPFFHLQLSIEKTQWNTVPAPKWLLKWQHAETMEANACAGESQCLEAQQKPCHLVSDGSSPFPIQVIYLFFITAVLGSLSCATGWWFKPRVFKLHVNTTSGLVSCSKKTCENESVLSGDISFGYWGLHLSEKMHRDLQIKLPDYLYSKVWLNNVICTKTGERS